jgi:hypothetical protein
MAAASTETKSAALDVRRVQFPIAELTHGDKIRVTCSSGEKESLDSTSDYFVLTRHTEEEFKDGRLRLMDASHDMRSAKREAGKWLGDELKKWPHTVGCLIYSMVEGTNAGFNFDRFTQDCETIRDDAVYDRMSGIYLERLRYLHPTAKEAMLNWSAAIKDFPNLPRVIDAYRRQYIKKWMKQSAELLLKEHKELPSASSQLDRLTSVTSEYCLSTKSVTKITLLQRNCIPNTEIIMPFGFTIEEFTWYY